MPLRQNKYGNYIYTPFDTFKRNIDEARAFEIEKKRWVEGYKDLTGRHYHFLTQGMVYSGTGLASRPYYRDDDRIVFELLTESDTSYQDLVFFSGRGVGKTVWLTEDTSYNANVHAGSLQAITACDLDRLKRYFLKLDKLTGDMDEAISPIITDQNNRIGMPERVLQYFRKTGRGKSKANKSLIFGRQTSKNRTDVTNISGARGIRVTVEEPFLHPHLTELLQSTKEVVIENKERIGYALMAGTLEEDSPMSCLDQLSKLIKIQENINMKVLFLPFHHGTYLKRDGTTDKKKAIDLWEQECENLDKMEDKSFLRSHLKNNPLTVEHVLSLADTGVIPPEAVAAIEDQKEKIRNNRVKIDTCIAKKEDLVLRSTGKIKILEYPSPDGVYVLGTDPIQIENTASKEGSLLVSVVMNYYTRQICALYAERNFNTDIVVNNLITLGKQYNYGKNMIENNQGHVLIKEIREKGYARLLSKQPKKTGLAVKETSGKTIYGVKMGAEATEYSHNLLVKFFIEHSDKIWFDEIFDDLNKYPHGNTDYIKALECALILIKDMELRNVTNAKEEVKYKIVSELMRDNSGRNVWVKIKKPI